MEVFEPESKNTQVSTTSCLSSFNPNRNDPESCDSSAWWVNVSGIAVSNAWLLLHSHLHSHYCYHQGFAVLAVVLVKESQVLWGIPVNFTEAFLWAAAYEVTRGEAVKAQSFLFWMNLCLTLKDCSQHCPQHSNKWSSQHSGHRRFSYEVSGYLDFKKIHLLWARLPLLSKSVLALSFIYFAKDGTPGYKVPDVFHRNISSCCMMRWTVSRHLGKECRSRSITILLSLSGLSILFMYPPISFSVLTQLVNCTDNCCSTAPSSALIAVPSIKHCTCAALIL